MRFETMIVDSSARARFSASTRHRLSDRDRGPIGCCGRTPNRRIVCTRLIDAAVLLKALVARARA